MSAPVKITSQGLVKAPFFRRFLAEVIDRLVPCPFLTYFFPFWSVVVIGYHLFNDALPGGRSIGKGLMGLKVVAVTDHSPCTLARSFLRNIAWTINQLTYLSVILIPLALIYDLMECLLVLFHPKGRRLGDYIAGTQVVPER